MLKCLTHKDHNVALIDLRYVSHMTSPSFVK